MHKYQRFVFCWLFNNLACSEPQKNPISHMKKDEILTQSAMHPRYYFYIHTCTYTMSCLQLFSSFSPPKKYAFTKHKNLRMFEVRTWKYIYIYIYIYIYNNIYKISLYTGIKPYLNWYTHVKTDVCI